MAWDDNYVSYDSENIGPAFQEFQRPDGRWEIKPSRGIPMSSFQFASLLDEDGTMSDANHEKMADEARKRIATQADPGGMMPYVLAAAVGGLAASGLGVAGGAAEASSLGGGLAAGAEASSVAGPFSASGLGATTGAGFGAELTGESLANMLGGLDEGVDKAVKYGIDEGAKATQNGAAQNIVEDTVGNSVEKGIPQGVDEITKSLQPPGSTGPEITDLSKVPTPPTSSSGSEDAVDKVFKPGVDEGGGSASGGGGGGGSKGLIQSILDGANENRALTTAGATLAGQLITGLGAPALAKSTAEAKAKADAEAAIALDASKRNATSFGGVGFRVTPTGKMLRTGLIGSRI